MRKQLGEAVGEVKTDIEIARAARKQPIMEVGARLGIPPEHLLPTAMTRPR